MKANRTFSPLWLWLLFVGLAAVVPAQDLAAALRGLSDEDLDRRLAHENTVRQLVQQAGAADDAQRTAVAQALLGAVASHSSPVIKRWLLEELSYIAGDTELTALSGLLGDPEVGEMARWVLVRVPSPAACDTLAAALGQADATMTIGLINALGVRGALRHAAAVQARISSEHAGVRRAALEALGRMAAPSSEPLLRGALFWEPPDERHAAWTSYVRLAELLAKGTARDRAAAGEMFEYLFVHGKDEHFRAAGLRGLAAVQGKKALRVLLLALESPLPAVRTTAKDALIALPGGKATTRAIAAHTGSPFLQRAVLEVLAGRGDAAAAKVAIEAANSADAGVRLAAIQALGRFHTAEVVPVLVNALDDADQAVQDAAADALASLPGSAITSTMIAALAGSPSARRVRLIQLLSRRGEPQVLPVLLRAVQDADAGVRVAAVEGLAGQRGAEAVSVLIEKLSSPHGEERAAAERSLINQPPSQANPALEQVARTGPPAARAAAMRVLAQRRDPAFVPLFISAAGGEDEATSLAALSGLKQLKPAEAADVLLALAKSGSAARKLAASDVYLDLAAAKRDQDPQGAIAMYLEIMEAAPEKQTLVRALDGLGRIESPAPLPHVEPYLQHDDAEVRAAASWAVIILAGHAGKAGDPERALALYHRGVLACTDAAALRLAAKHAGMAAEYLGKKNYRLDPEQHAGFIKHWHLLGPVAKRARLLEDDIVPTDRPIDPTVKIDFDHREYAWVPFEVENADGKVDLDSVFGQHDDCGAYAYTEIDSAVDQDVLLKIGHDDDLYVWVNGRLVHRYNGASGNEIDQTAVLARLRKGRNYILLKVLDLGAAWGFCVRPTTLDGKTPILTVAQ